MKVIFLDNDGVICLSNNWGGRDKKWARYRSANPESSTLFKEAPVSVRFDNFDTKAVRVLNEILLETGAEIVVSSDWKKHGTLEELGDYYIEQGIIKRPIATTKNVSECLLANDFKFHFDCKYEQERCFEIKQYLYDNTEITQWVVIDDLDLGNTSFIPNSHEWGVDNFVRCIRMTEGIKQAGIKEKIINILNN
jgi:hypothetical protein